MAAQRMDDGSVCAPRLGLDYPSVHADR